MDVLVLPVLHREVVPPHRAVVPVDRYNRCLEQLYRSRIGPKVVPAMYRSTTGLVSVVVRFLGGCGPVVPVIPVLPVPRVVVPLIAFATSWFCLL